MAEFDYDYFVIGAGSGGVASARRAAAYGARVAIAESVRIGGTCVLRGCVPKKLLIYGVHFHEEFEDARGYGWTIDNVRFDWGKLIAAKDRELDRLNAIYIKMLQELEGRDHRGARNHRRPAQDQDRQPDRQRQAYPGGHRRPAGNAADPRHRACHHLERGA